MGGSGIAGDLWRAILARECPLPVFNVRGYELPPAVDGRTLVVASSFSGDTEEVLSSFQQALARGARAFVITTGGQLLVTARANGVPAFVFSYSQEPRAAIGWGLMPLLALGESMQLTQGIERDVGEMLDVLRQVAGELDERVPESENRARKLAAGLAGKLTVIYAAGPLVEVARRWKTQLNESAKAWAFWEEMPEAHHNAITGYEFPAAIAQSAAVVFLESPDLVHPRVALRYEWTKDLLRRHAVPAFDVSTRGRSTLAQLMSLVISGDYVSAYLALLNGVDPTPTPVIDDLKSWLRAR
jgi:glucose/mannose-6-phosphate isomerase